MALTILVIGLLVFFGHVLSALFQRAKVPDVLVLMVAGILLGPVFHVVQGADLGQVGGVFSTLALIVILFEGGIHLNLRLLGWAAADTLVITLATSAATLLVVAHLADLLLPLEFSSALLLGAILSGTSSAVVVPMLRPLGLGGSRSGTILFVESALTDVLTIVLTLGLIQALLGAGPDGLAGLAAAPLASGIGGAFFFAALFGTAGALFWSAVLERIRRFPNTVFTTLAYVFVLYGLTELAGYSGAIAALAFGVTLANLPSVPRFLRTVFRFRLTPFAASERAFFAEVVFLVKTFFFVLLGLSMTFTSVPQALAGLALAAVAFVTRVPVIRFLGHATLSRREAALMVALVPKGLAAAVLAGMPVRAGIAGGSVIQGTVYAVVFFSIALCAVLVLAIERGWLAGPLARGFAKFPLEAPPAPAPPAAPAPAVAAVSGLSSADLAALQEPNPIGELGADPDPR